MVCKAAAAALPDLPFLYVRDLRERNKKEAIKEVFRRARHLSPCLLAFEDMDGFVDKENRTVFLNELDGFQDNAGLLIIASSNHPGKIDEALLKRPSRFDRVFHVGLPGPEERREFCRRLLSRGALAEHRAPSLDVEALAVLRRAQSGVTALDATYAEAVLEQVEELRAHLKRMRAPDMLAEMSGMDGMGFR